jgi:hypothetical protein
MLRMLSDVACRRYTKALEKQCEHAKRLYAVEFLNNLERTRFPRQEIRQVRQ